MNIKVGAKQIKLKDSDIIGSGGEATIYRMGRQALKIYHKSTRKRQQKLKDLIKKSQALPTKVAKPLELVYDGRGQLRGFSMRRVKKAAEVLAELAKKRYRKVSGVTTQDIVELFLDGYETLTQIHKAGFIVGDLNDLNELFVQKEMLFIDVDSFQFDNYPCMVGTEAFLDPLLYGINLDKKPSFVVGNDWYSFAVLLFKTVTMAHPFGGIYKGVNTLLERAQKRIPVYEKGVRYPKTALSFEVFSDGLLTEMERYFKSDYRKAFSKKSLEEYLGSLVLCLSCGAYYSGERSICPVCSEKTAQQIQKLQKEQQTHDKIKVTRIFDGTAGVIRQSHEGFYIAEIEKATIKVHRENTTLQIFDRDGVDQIDIAGGHIIKAKDTELEIYKDGNLRNTVTSQPYNGKLVFGCNDHILYHIQANYLMATNFDTGASRQLVRVMENQTWFKVADKTDTVVGFFRLLGDFRFFIQYKNDHHDLEDIKLDGKENVIDLSVRFDNSSALLILKTVMKTRSYIRIYQIGFDGKLRFDKKLEAMGSQVYKNLHGVAYFGGMLLHPTDDGVISERLSDGSLKKFTETENYVVEDSTLYPHQKGILVVNTDSVDRIEIRK